jgi:hypothetical protein
MPPPHGLSIPENITIFAGMGTGRGKNPAHKRSLLVCPVGYTYILVKILSPVAMYSGAA